MYSITGGGGTEGNPTLLSGSGKNRGYSGDIGRALHPRILKGWPHQFLKTWIFSSRILIPAIIVFEISHSCGDVLNPQ